jgi:hypothetical protein
MLPKNLRSTSYRAIETLRSALVVLRAAVTASAPAYYNTCAYLDESLTV